MTANAPTWPTWRRTLPPNPQRRAEGGQRVAGEPASFAADGRVAAPPPPTISYVTVVRNAVRTVERTLASVQAQRGVAVEHIVVDGASTDGTLEVVERHAAQLAYYVSEPDGGLYDALNKAVELAAGDYVCVLNADDWLTRDAAQAVADHARGADRGAARLVCTAAWALREDRRDKLWLPEALDAGSVLRCANVCHNAVYATRAAYAASGPYRTDLKIAADFAWLVACIDAGVEIVRVDTPTVHYSLGGLSSDTRRHTTDCAAIVRDRFPALDDEQAWALLHCFHQFRGNLAPLAASRPAHHGRFLRDLARAHAADTELLRALALAGFATLRHPDDRDAAGRLSPRQRIARSLYKRGVQLRAWLRR